MSNNDVIDLALLTDYQDSLGKDVIEQMFDLYVEQSEIYINDIVTASTSNDDNFWHEKCHKLKGAASSSGLMELRKFIVEIENSKAASAEKLAIVETINELNIKGIMAFKVWLNC
ncbi:MAG: Hpt domain-containing protein [Thalassotalea sp.]